MKDLLKNGYRAKKRPSGHDISDNFSVDNGAAIPPNLLAIPNTESNSHYIRYCNEHEIKVHPARYPAELPEFFIRMLTEKKDFVLDPFAGSCVTGEVAERLGRKWVCIELLEEYLEGALGRFEYEGASRQEGRVGQTHYKISRPGSLWNGEPIDKLPSDGGKDRKQFQKQAKKAKT